MITQEKFEDILSQIGKSLNEEVTICLIGSTAGIINGQPGRATVDIDIWDPMSSYKWEDLKDICKNMVVSQFEIIFNFR